MTPAAPGHARRIIVALRSHSEADPALDAATLLAQALQAELFGLFVEEEAALHSSALPLARLVAGAAAPAGMRRRALSPETMLAAFEHDAMACRRLLCERARRARLAWRFDRVRGEGMRAAGQAAGAGDILLLQEAHVGAGMRGIVADARAAAKRLGGMILLGPWPRRSSGPVVAVVESLRAGGGGGGDADGRILHLAAHIAGARQDPLLLFVAGGTREEAEEALRHARGRLPAGGRVEGYAFLGDPVAEICHGLRVCAPSFVLLDVEGALFRDDARAERLLRSARAPVALLKSGDSPG